MQVEAEAGEVELMLRFGIAAACSKRMSRHFYGSQQAYVNRSLV